MALFSYHDRMNATAVIKTTPVAGLQLGSEGWDGLNYLQSITEEDLRSVCFKDSLAIVGNESSTSLSVSCGRFVISVSRRDESEFVKYPETCFRVKAKCYADVENVTHVTEVDSEVLPSMLETIHQKHYEYFNVKHGEAISMHKLTEFNKRMDTNNDTESTQGYFLVQAAANRQEEMFSDESIDKRRFLSASDAIGFMSEGANILLIRLLAKRPPESTLRFTVLDDELKLCIVEYDVQTESQPQVFGRHFSGCQRVVKRSVFPHSSPKQPEVWEYHLSDDGRLHHWKHRSLPILMRSDNWSPLSTEEAIDRHFLHKDHHHHHDPDAVSSTEASTNMIVQNQEHVIDEQSVNLKETADNDKRKILVEPDSSMEEPITGAKPVPDLLASNSINPQQQLVFEEAMIRTNELGDRSPTLFQFRSAKEQLEALSFDEPGDKLEGDLLEADEYIHLMDKPEAETEEENDRHHNNTLRNKINAQILNVPDEHLVVIMETMTVPEDTSILEEEEVGNSAMTSKSDRHETNHEDMHETIARDNYDSAADREDENENRSAFTTDKHNIIIGSDKDDITTRPESVVQHHELTDASGANETHDQMDSTGIDSSTVNQLNAASADSFPKPVESSSAGFQSESKTGFRTSSRLCSRDVEGGVEVFSRKANLTLDVTSANEADQQKLQPEQEDGSATSPDSVPLTPALNSPTGSEESGATIRRQFTLPIQLNQRDQLNIKSDWDLNSSSTKEAAGNNQAINDHQMTSTAPVIDHSRSIVINNSTPEEFSASTMATYSRLKMSATNSCRSYITQHPEFKVLVKDFVVAVLSDRPVNIAKYAAAHFGSHIDGGSKAQ